MADKIKMRRGEFADLPNLDEGEFGLVTDRSTVYIGNPNDGGNVLLNPVKVGTDGYTLDGYLLPTTDNVHGLGNLTNRWSSLTVGPGSIHLVGKFGEVTVPAEWNLHVDDDGNLIIDRNGVAHIRVDPITGLVLEPTSEFKLGVAALVEATAPAAEDGYGKLYVQDDGHIYYKNETGTQYNLNFGPFRGTDGNVTAPTYSFLSNTNTGMYLNGGVLRFTISGADKWEIGSGALLSFNSVVRADNGIAGAPTYSFGSNTNMGMYKAAADTLGFSTSGSEAVRIDSSGNVGIGGIPPTAQLEVANDILATDAVFKGGLSVGFTDTPAADTVRVGDVNFSMDYNSGNPAIRFESTDRLQYTRPGGPYEFFIGSQAKWTIENLKSYTQNAVTSASNQVGVLAVAGGTTGAFLTYRDASAGGTLLGLSGSNHGTLTFSGSTGGSIYTTAINSSLVFGTESISVMRINNNQTITMGNGVTTLPFVGDFLYIDGNVRIDDQTLFLKDTNSDYLKYSTSFGSINPLGPILSGTGGGALVTHTGSGIALRWDSSERVAINPGTSSLTGAQFHVLDGPAWSSESVAADIVARGNAGRHHAIAMFDLGNAQPIAIYNRSGDLVISEMPSLGDTVTAPNNIAFFETASNGLRVGSFSGFFTPNNTLEVVGNMVVGSTYALGIGNPADQAAPANSLLVEGQIGAGVTSVQLGADIVFKVNNFVRLISDKTTISDSINPLDAIAANGAQLHVGSPVAGTSSGPSNNSDVGEIIIGNNEIVGTTLDRIIGQLSFYSSSGSNSGRVAALKSHFDDNSGGGGGLGFYTGSGVSGATTRQMYLTSGGDFALGVNPVQANIANKFEVEGGVLIGSTSFAAGVTGFTDGLLVEGDAAIGYTSTGGLSNSFTIAGNASIGTSSAAPALGLLVQGDLVVNGTFGTLNPLAVGVSSVYDNAQLHVAASVRRAAIFESPDTGGEPAVLITDDGSTDERPTLWVKGDAAGASTDLLFVRADGRTGIGTADPEAFLHVALDAYASIAGDTLFPGIKLENSGDAALTILAGTSSTGAVVFTDPANHTSELGTIEFDNTADELKLTVLNVDAITIDAATQNVGIPNGNLTITNGDIFMASSGSQIRANTGDSSSTPGFTWDGDTDTGMYYAGANSLGLSTGTNPALTINSSQDVNMPNGKLAIGTTATADQTLHVHKATAGAVASNANSVITAENNTHAYLQFLTPNTVESGILFGDVNDIDVGQLTYDHTNNRMEFFTNGTIRALTLDSSQNAVIGNLTVADTKLHVYANSAGAVTANANANLTVEDNGNNFIQFLSPNTSTQGLYFGDTESVTSGEINYNHSNNSLSIYTNSNTLALTLDSSQNMTLEGVLALDEQSVSPSATAGYGKIYTKTDNYLYYLDDSGQETLISGQPIAPTTSGGDAWIAVEMTANSTAIADPTYLNPFDTTQSPATATTTHSSQDITYTPASGRFTVGSDGTYAIDAVIYGERNSSSGTHGFIQLLKNGAVIWGPASANMHSSVDPEALVARVILDLVATDYIEVEFRAGVAATVTAHAGSTFTMNKINQGFAQTSTGPTVTDGSIWLNATSQANSGVIWFKTFHNGTASNHHMRFGADKNAARAESLSIWHENVTAPLASPNDTGKAFRFQWDGNAYATTAWLTVGIDLAEKFPNHDDNLEPGDVISLNTSKNTHLSLSGSNDKNILGVYSEKPGFVLGGSTDDCSDGEGIPLALTGRVPVKVTNENGAIYPGDPLTAASRPGYSAKAIHSCRIIGYALEGFDEQEGKIEVFLNTQDWVNPDDYNDVKKRISMLEVEINLLKKLNE